MNHISNCGDTDKSEGDIKGKVDRPSSPATESKPLQNLTECQHLNRLRITANHSASTDKDQALALLALQEPVEPDVIRKRYRELAFEHHPDRGGSAEKLATINEAMDTLRVYYAL